MNYIMDDTRQRSNTTPWIERRLLQIETKKTKRYVLLCADSMIPFALRIVSLYPHRFKYIPIEFNKYNDGTDDITISGFTPENEIAGLDILFLASFHSNDVTLSQFSVLIVLLQSFIESLTIVLPYYPVATVSLLNSLSLYSLSLVRIVSFSVVIFDSLFLFDTTSNKSYFSINNTTNN